MKFKKDDFSKDFLNRFKSDELDILIDFCNCFYQKFGSYFNEQEIIDRIQSLDSTIHINDPYMDAMATHYVKTSDYFKKIDSLYIRINDAQWKTASQEERKAILYHELMHHFSTKEIPGKKVQRGLKEVDGGTSYLDEIMTEYYATELLKIDGINFEEHHSTQMKRNPKVDRSIEYITSKGKGYLTIAQIGQVYDNIFGKRIFAGKTEDYEKFKKEFNSRFKEIGDNPLDVIQNELQEAFPVSITRDEDNKEVEYLKTQKIYKCYKTALDIFRIDRKDRYEKRGFDLYDYLNRSRRVMKSLPTRDTQNFGMDKDSKGIPEELFSKINQMDNEFICKYVRPDVLQIKDEEQRKREINRITTVINVLRENIETLTKEDIENISFGKVDDYTHNGLDCIVINAGEKSFETFINNSIESNLQFMPYCKFKRPDEFEIFEEQQGETLREEFKTKEYSLSDDYTMATIMNVGGQYFQYGLVKSNGKLYTTSGEVKEVELQDIQRLSTKSKDGQILQQEMGMSPSETQRIKEEQQRIEEEVRKQKERRQTLVDNANAPKKKRISTERLEGDISEGLTKEQIDAIEVNNSQQVMKDKIEMKKLRFMGRNLTAEQQQRLTQLEHIYQTNQKQVKQQGQGMGR